MKTLANLLLVFTMISFSCSTILDKPDEKQMILGKWKLVNVIADSTDSGFLLAFLSDLQGLIVEYKKDNTLQIHLSDQQKNHMSVTETHDTYYFSYENGKNVLIQGEHGNENRYELLVLTDKELTIKSNHYTLFFSR